MFTILLWKHLKQFVFSENLIRGLDDDEVGFLEIVDKAKLDAEKKQQIEEQNELKDFRERVRLIQENAIDQKINAVNVKQKTKQVISNTNRPTQKSILSGIVRKRKIDEPSKDAPSIVDNVSETKLAERVTDGKIAECDEDAAGPAEKKANISTQNISLDKGALKCVGILPGIGRYKESSDSDKSTDTEDEYDFSEFDWVGRKIKRDSNDGECH